MEQKNNILVWIDLEMTGLNPDIDTILEISTILTNDDLIIIAEGPTIAIRHPDFVVKRMSDEVEHMHIKSGLLDRIKKSTLCLSDAQEQTLKFIKQYCQKRTSPLCGNSIYQDRIFLRRYMPYINDYLHYRNLDVSTIKELVTRWYPNDAHAIFQKQEVHRAYEDIKESIEELRHYRKYFFKIP